MSENPELILMRWLIDAMNVIGSRPDGWWRDREGATRKLVDQVSAWAGDEPVTVVLDTGPDDLLGTVGSVTVVRAPRRGRNAADDEIVRLVETDPDALVVTSDAELVSRVRALGAAVEGAGTFRRRLESPP
ncbi:NYN domain-containing protein [Solirubrobacter ginsenosidimutans]|uniref:NYN domain-containing protein n=2 Tax=Solirubrobacter ginsenosidimutans TaxID=490573 RepID=A0A9X3MPI9_9ACTN|nr:NYN domain-containing protein [Solirubrobacter ginsenosidimutans]